MLLEIHACITFVSSLSFFLFQVTKKQKLIVFDKILLCFFMENIGEFIHVKLYQTISENAMGKLHEIP